MKRPEAWPKIGWDYVCTVLKWHYDEKSGYLFLEKGNIASNKHYHQILKSDSIIFLVYFVVVFVYLTAAIKKCPINEWMSENWWDVIYLTDSQTKHLTIKLWSCLPTKNVRILKVNPLALQLQPRWNTQNIYRVMSLKHA